MRLTPGTVVAPLFRFAAAFAGFTAVLHADLDAGFVPFFRTADFAGDFLAAFFDALFAAMWGLWLGRQRLTRGGRRRWGGRAPAAGRAAAAGGRTNYKRFRPNSRPPPDART